MNGLKHDTVFDIYLFYHRLIDNQLKNINLVAEFQSYKQQTIIIIISLSKRNLKKSTYNGNLSVGFTFYRGKPEFYRRLVSPMHLRKSDSSMHE
jgi:hypothetical protein